MNIKNDWDTKTKLQRQAILSRLISGASDMDDFMGLVSAGSLGVFASTGPNFQYAIFGRDSIEVAEDLLGTHRLLAQDIIITMATLQGTKFDPVTEEEPGKIHHEYRSLIFDGQLIPESAAKVMYFEQEIKGAPKSDSWLYYGSYDSTPLYLRLVGKYIDLYGSEILDKVYPGTDNNPRTIYESVKCATDWLTQKLISSPWGLLEYKRINPLGEANQVWKDSDTAYMYSSGEVADYDQGIASVELQGYAYDAFLVASSTLPAADKARLLKLAKSVQQNTLEMLWMPEKKFFAHGLARDADGNTKQIDTLTSNAGLLMDSNLLLDLPKSQRHKYTEPIVKKLLSNDFMTPAGIRCRALQHKDLLRYVDYHGSYAVWPKESFDLARGLRMHGKVAEALDLERRILKTVETAGEFYELFYVEADNEVWYDRDAAMQHFLSKAPDVHIPVPEPGQAWVISAVYGSLTHLRQVPSLAGNNAAIQAQSHSTENDGELTGFVTELQTV